VVFDLLGEVRVDGSKSGPRLRFEVDEIEHHVDEIAELIFVLGGNPSIWAITPGGMYWAYS